MPVNKNLIDLILPGETGYPPEKAGEDTPDQMRGAAEAAGITVVDFPQHLWVERKYWKDVAHENDINRTWPVDYLDRFTNQNPTHECTSHSLRAGFEAAWNRQRRIAVGPAVPKQRLPISATSASVWVSCISVYAEANPGQWGGASCRQVLEIAGKRGFIPDKIQPKNWGFKHTIHGTCGGGGINQSSGSWVRVAQFPEGWKETAIHFRPAEVIIPDSWEQIVCLLLGGYIVNVGRDGHAVPLGRWIDADEVAAYDDSYDVVRYDSISRLKKSVSGASAIITTTTPDDWTKPAG